MKIRRLICLLVALTMVFSMTTITADAASFKSKPTGVKAKCVNGATVNVSCKAKKGATGYCFYYSTKKRGKYALAAESGSRSARVGGLTAGKTYYFKVQAYQGTDARVYSKMSKPAKCKTVLKKPTAKVTDKCGCKVCLYLKGQEGTKGFAVYRSTKKKKGFKKIKTVNGGPAVSWNDKSVKSSTKYYYKVKAVSGKYSTKYSKVISVKTEAWHPDGNDWSFGPGGPQANYQLIGGGKNKLTNRNILFLGSSITYGSATGGVSFADYIRVRNNANVKKLAISGTTLARPNVSSSYVSRLHNWNSDGFCPDIFACQLSLNDSFVSYNIPLGTVPTINDFDSLTDEDVENLYKQSGSVAGAIAYVTAYAYKNWPDCKVVFYTVRNNGYNTKYGQMRDVLWAAKAKYGNRIEIIDMWNMSALTNLWGNNYCMYMDDANHPKMAGYLYQWTPEFESKMIAWMPAMPNWKVEWKNDNDEALETDTGLRRGERLSYNGAEPTKTAPEGAEYTNKFIGWRNAAEGEEGEVYSPDQIKKMVVTGNMVFVAEFEEVPNVQEPPAQDPPEQSGQQGQSDQNAQPEQPEQTEQSAPEGPAGESDDTSGILKWFGIAA